MKTSTMADKKITFLRLSTSSMAAFIKLKTLKLMRPVYFGKLPVYNALHADRTGREYKNIFTHFLPK